MQIPIYRAVSIFLCHREGRRPVAIRIPKFFRFCKEKRIATPVCALARNDIALFDGLTDKSEFVRHKNKTSRLGGLVAHKDYLPGM